MRPLFSVILILSSVSIYVLGYCTVNQRALSSFSTRRFGNTHSDAIVHKKSIKNIQGGLKIRRLPHSNLEVSEICLGTLNFGDQLNEEQSIAIMDSAVGDYGINFLDTSELSPAPYAESTAGSSERIVGRWLKTKKRSDIIISGKICGYSNEITWLHSPRGTGIRGNREQIVDAVDKQLERLGTDYIDLLQIQWPDRYVPMQGEESYDFRLERNGSTPIFEQMKVMAELIQAGKIRSFGVSNETPYGIGQWTALADANGLPRPVSTQNAYNLLARNDFETGMLEACSPLHGDVGLLAFSPLAGGALSGKYLQDKTNPSSRLHKYIGFMYRYISPPCLAAVREYQNVAQAFSLPLSVVALAFVYTRPFVSSTIIGVSSISQLRDNVLSLNVPLNGELIDAINQVYRRYIDPTKGVFEVVDPFVEYVDPSKLPWGANDVDMDPELDILINQRMSKF